MKKLTILLTASVLLACALFVGCGKKEDTGPVTLIMWTHEDPNRQKLEEGYAAEYMAQHPNVTIKYSVYPSTKIQDLIPTAYAAKNAPSIWNMELQKAFPLLAQGLVAPVDPEALGLKKDSEIASLYMPNMLAPVTDADGSLLGKKGKVYGLPFELNNFCIYLNKKIFRDAGLDPDKDYPKTWEDVMNVSEKIVKRNGDIITRRGFDFRYGDYLITWTPMVTQLGGAVVSADGKEAIVNTEAWEKALEYMRQWGPNGKNLGSPTYTAARKLFDNDKNEIAMHLSGIYQEARMLKANPDFYNSSDWMVIPYPIFEGGKNVTNNYYFQYYMVNSQIPEREQKEAWRFIAFLLSHPVDYLEKVALVQPRKDLVESDLFKNMPYSKVFMDDLQHAEPVYYGAASWQINQLIKEAIENVMMNNVSPKDAVAKLKKSAQALLDEQM
ncbi:extracellular solute-binding protein [Treponema lecithinolyticum]|uniref:extracellular solute-binding protein n=1 Tax=Treponema lecithinolyticum TaxID=53418 RepID=UPI0028EA0A2F|nr:extracellular solute-binding protein [Treponema lecithinolyticum]